MGRNSRKMIKYQDMLRPIEDLTGEKFGKWNVINNYSGRNTSGLLLCLCCCDCQYKLPKKYREYRKVLRCTLLNGTSKSCGCEKSPPPLKKRGCNKYDLVSRPYGVGYASNTNKEFYFDLNDYEIIRNYHWRENDQKYIVSNGETGETNIRMHRLILGAKKGQIVDHKNMHRNDNRRSNIRIANKSLNGMNRPCNSNNKLQEKGIMLVKRKKGDRYIAKINKKGKQIHIGTFDTLEEAVSARKKKEIELYGEFAYEKTCE